MSKLCASLRDETKLVLVGDADQLSPVQGGAVFNGLIKAPKAESYLGTICVLGDQSPKVYQSLIFCTW